MYVLSEEFFLTTCSIGPINTIYILVKKFGWEFENVNKPMYYRSFCSDCGWGGTGEKCGH